MKTALGFVAALLLLTGCITGKETYSILDLKTGKSLTLKKQSAYPEEIIDMNDKTFRIFTRSGEGFEIWDVHYNGSLATNFSGRHFSDHILLRYGLFKEGFAVSSDASRIAYFDLPSGELRVFNVKDGSQRTLLANLCGRKRSNGVFAGEPGV
jgi:hypothetical protein